MKAQSFFLNFKTISSTSFVLLSKQDVPLFTSDGSMFYTVLAAKQGARGEFHHIAGLSAQVGKTPVTLLILRNV